VCLILFAVGSHPIYKLVIAANRDEFYERPSAPASFWPDAPHLFAGRDLRAGGTWLGVTRKGRIAAITNYRDPASMKMNAPSRGELVTNYLLGDESPLEYLNDLEGRGKEYNGFNLIVGTEDVLCWYSNRGDGVYPIAPGVHGLSNHLLDTPWPKVSRGKEALARLLSEGRELSPEALFQILLDRSIAPDEKLPDTGVGTQMERLLSPLFITISDYGTRSSSVVLVDRQDRVTFVERTYDPGPERGITRTCEFSIEK